MGEFVESFKSKLTHSSILLDEIYKKERDLEFLIEQLEEIGNKAYLGDAVRSRGVPSDSIPNGIPELAQMANTLLEALRKEIYRHYGSITGTAHIDSYTRLINAFCPDSRLVVIFTTNYDNAIEHLCEYSDLFSLTDGFAPKPKKRDHFWSRRVFDAFQPGKSDNTDIVLFKLHGSANWLKYGDSIIQAPRIYAGDNEEYKHVLIYPAKRKVAIDEPFFTAYDYLEKCLSYAKECLVIGYSFRDYDTLMRFKAASLSNPRLRTFILDPSAYSIVKLLAPHGLRAVPIAFPFVSKESEYISELQRLVAVAP